MKKIAGTVCGIVACCLALIIGKFWTIYFPLVRTNLDMEAPVPFAELSRQYFDSFLVEWWGLVVLAFLGFIFFAFAVLAWKCLAVNGFNHSTDPR